MSEPTPNQGRTKTEPLPNNANNCNKHEEQKEGKVEATQFLSDRAAWVAAFVPQLFRGLVLDDLADVHPGRMRVNAAASEYAQGLQQGQRQPLIVYGSPGSGKTELASAVWNAVAPAVPDRSEYADAASAGTADNIVFVRGDELPACWKGVCPGSDLTAQQWQHHLATAYLAVIDDLDKCPAGGWSSQLLSLLDARLWQRRLPTILTMNHTPHKLAQKHGECGEPMVERFERAGGVLMSLSNDRQVPGL